MCVDGGGTHSLMASTKRSCSSSDHVCRCFDTTYGFRFFPSAWPVIAGQAGAGSASSQQRASCAHQRAAAAARQARPPEELSLTFKGFHPTTRLQGCAISAKAMAQWMAPRVREANGQWSATIGAAE